MSIDHTIGSAEWFKRWMLWCSKTASMYASFVTTAMPEDVVVDAAEPNPLVTPDEAGVVIGGDGTMVLEGSSGPLYEVFVGTLEVWKVVKLVVLVQGHVVNVIYSIAV